MFNIAPCSKIKDFVCHNRIVNPNCNACPEYQAYRIGFIEAYSIGYYDKQSGKPEIIGNNNEKI